MEMVDVKKARVGHPSLHFASQLIFQKISTLSLFPLLHIQNVYNIFMAELMSAIFPTSSLSSLAHTDSFLLSAAWSLNIIFFNSISFSTNTEKVILMACRCLSLPLQCELWRTDPRIYSFFVLATLPRTNETTVN